MSGQSAALTLKEACMMQERVQVAGTHACTHGGSGKKSSGGDSTHRKSSGKKHMEQVHHDPADMHNK
jgi:hypothetical protein